MIGVFSQIQSNVSRNEIIPSAENGFNSFEHVATQYNQQTTALFVMPGMRFQSNERRAFQVSLAGVSVFSWANEYRSSDNFSFPIPMCSWFFRF